MRKINKNLVLYPKNFEDEVEKELEAIDDDIRQIMVGEWDKIDNLQSFQRIQELNANNITPSEEYIQEFKYFDDPNNKKRTGRRGKPIKRQNNHLDIDFMLDMNE